MTRSPNPMMSDLGRGPHDSIPGQWITLRKFSDCGLLKSGGQYPLMIEVKSHPLFDHLVGAAGSEPFLKWTPSLLSSRHVTLQVLGACFGIMSSKSVPGGLGQTS